VALFLGLLSGTSADAIDAALVDFATSPPCLCAARAYPLPDDFRARVLSLSQHHRLVDPAELAQLDVRAGHLFARAALDLLDHAGISPAQVQAIGSHGQTLYHDPGALFPYTWQIGDAHVIAEQTGITTVADFRRRDIAAGGQGAPLIPLFHQVFLSDTEETRVVLNIGGIANITVLSPSSPLIAFDTGPGNALLDAWAHIHLGVPLDKDGTWAACGHVIPTLLETWLQDPYFQRPPPKSTGRDYFNLSRFSPGAAAPMDVQTTLAALTVQSVAAAMRPYAPRRVLICGGGVHNPVLRAGLQSALPECEVQSSAVFGIDPDWMEALGFAWLAKQRLAGIALNSGIITGARAPLALGAVFAAAAVAY
jgi:anhydro-N-acetylmuramic acid kinase